MGPRNKIAVGAAFAAALIAGCRKPAPAPDPGANVTLAPPTPSSATVASPLGSLTSDYTNEMQAQHLREQASELGITKFTQPSVQQDEDAGPPLTTEEGVERTRELTKQVAAQRRAIEKGRDKTVALPSSTPGIIPSRKEGAPIEPAPDEPAPKDPESK